MRTPTDHGDPGPHYVAHIEYGREAAASATEATEEEAHSSVLDMAEYYSGLGHQIRELRVDLSCARCGGHGTLIRTSKKSTSYPDCPACLGRGYKTLCSIKRRKEGRP